MSHGGKLTPNLDEKSTKLLNLTVLQRIDPFVEEILITAAHVTFYEFNIDNSQWSRKDVEGSLFVVKRNTQPRFQFIVMNRRNTDNLVENLLGDFEYELQVPYLLYRNASQEVNGIWFYDAHECEEVGNLFSRILNAYSKVPTKSKVSPMKSEVEEIEAVPTPTEMDCPLEPSSSTTPNVADVPDDRSFVNFFSTAMNAGQPYNSTANVRSDYPQITPLPTVLTAQTPATVSNSTPIMSILQNPESNTGVTKRSTDLVKPSTFFGPTPSSSPLVMPPIALSVPTAPPLNPPGNIHRTYGAPLLQPFPPPTPPPSLTPAYVPPQTYGPVISREKVAQALQMLVKDNQFIDMVYQAVVNAHES